MNETQRNPIITFHEYNIKFIGDCHLGKIFRTGVPSSKYNLREEQIFKDFEYHMDQGKNCLFTVIVGDLFNSFKVSNEVLLKAYNTLCKYINKESYTSTIIIIPGNHDLSKDSTKISSYFLLTLLLPSLRQCLLSLLSLDQLFLASRPIFLLVPSTPYQNHPCQVVAPCLLVPIPTFPTPPPYS